MKRMKCLISAGPTREWLDPVRFISNPSSGKMGYALAKAAASRDMDVHLVSGPTDIIPLKGIKISYVETALEMNAEMNRSFEESELIIMAAAVCDHRPLIQWKQKQKKKDAASFIELIENPDVLKGMGKRKSSSQVLVGFAAETENHLANAREKIFEKNLDWILVNDVSSKSSGFQSDFNKVTILSKNGDVFEFDLLEKNSLAMKILDIIEP